ncbi:MAG: MBOAT family protein [Oscillospiraceae bacterium]|nr:MBOAT family protein [Oscillospiraceae bacterium]
MLFSSIVFLYAFLPLTLLVYYAVPRRFRNTVLLIASLLFYFYGEQKYILLLILSSVSDYLHGLYIESHRGTRKAKTALISSIVINLGMLGIFKYTDFLIGTVNSLFGTSIPLTGLPLPIGISFFTFQTMSYSIDVYRGDAHAERSFHSFATYVCLFPQLVAGPIVRYTDIGAELNDRSLSLDRFALGVRRFSVGLGKKVLIANLLGELVSAYHATPEPTVLFAWMSAVAYALQIYYDFSGYSDMAIGLGHLLGFTFPENFRHPFCSASITEFWRRWHMTMSFWFRDYVYIPLGGNRCSTKRWIFNVMVVWSLTGLWHGAAWNFVAWGVGYGLILLAERFFIGKLLDRIGPLRYVYTLLVTLVMFTVFSGTDVLSTLGIMFGGAAWSNAAAVYYLKSYAVILAVAAIGSTPVIGTLGRKIECTKAVTLLEPIMVAGLLLLSTAYLVDGSFNPFLYFRF